MNQQVTRIALVLFAIIGVFIGVRAITVPKTYGLDGSFDSAAPAKIAAHPAKFVGRQACADCHDDESTLSPHVKSGVGCETCHGPGAKHIDDYDVHKMPVPSGREFCLRCHATNLARRADFPQVSPEDHNPGQDCISCHTIHPQTPPDGKGAPIANKPGDIALRDAEKPASDNKGGTQ